MEIPSIFPEIEIVPGLRKVGKFIKHCVSFCPLQAPSYMSDHYREAPLDLPIEPVTALPGQPEWDDHYDSDGNYFDRESE